MKVFVINLVKDAERRESITSQLRLANIDFEIFNAILGKELSSKDLLVSYNNNQAFRHQSRPLTPSEIGCALSHVNLYKHIYENNIPISLILEDDVTIPPNLNEILVSIVQQVNPNEPDLILLSEAKYIQKIYKEISDRLSIHPFKSGYYTSSYVITQKAAEILFKKLFPIGDVADCWNRIARHKLIDIYAFNQPIINQNQTEFGSSTTSDIQKILPKTIAGKLKFKTHRIIWSVIDTFVAIYHKQITPYSGLYKR